MWGWNRGLTKEDDPRVKANAEAISIAKRNKPQIPSYGMRGKRHSQETRQKIRQKLLGRPSNRKGTLGLRAELNPMYGKSHSEKTRMLIREKALKSQTQASRTRWLNPDYRLKQETRMLSPEYRQHQAEIQRNKWQESEYREKQLLQIYKGRARRPTTPERKLIEIIEKAGLPFRYVGDGSFIIQGFCPDFLNVNGKKQLIEVFGDYWHNRKNMPWHQTELGRIGLYSQFGFDCLVIWDYELKDESKILQKLKAFDRKRR